MNIKKGDNVKIIAVKDRGKSGKVLAVFSDSNRISIEGLNVFKKHKRPTKQGQKGEIISLARPMDASNIMLICGSCKKPTRVGQRAEGDRKVRFCKKCKASI